MYWKLKKWNKKDRERAIDRISTLRQQIAKEIPRRTATETLLLATWNIRDFDSNKFKEGPRLDETFYYLAEVISAFDLVAIQEVNDDMRPFERLMDLLGPAWRYIATDTTAGGSGNGERMVFVFDSRKVEFKHIAGEIMLPRTSLIEGREQFARSPFLVRFQSGWFKFNLCTVHLYYGDDAGEGKQRRVAEIDTVARFLRQRAEKDGENYILLGDMNVVNPEDDTMKALLKHKFVLPAHLTEDSTDLRWASNMSRSRHYDQIAFLPREGELALGPSENNAGVFNYYQSVFTESDAEMYHPLGKGNKRWPESVEKRKKYFINKWRTWQMSDHLPLFIELKIDFTENYLARIRQGTQPIDRPRADATEN